MLKTVQARLDQHPEKMTIRRQTAEHPFGTIKCWMGARTFSRQRLPKVATEMALNVLAYNMKRGMAMIGEAALFERLDPTKAKLAKINTRSTKASTARTRLSSAT